MNTQSGSTHVDRALTPVEEELVPNPNRAAPKWALPSRYRKGGYGAPNPNRRHTRGYRGRERPGPHDASDACKQRDYQKTIREKVKRMRAREIGRKTRKEKAVESVLSSGKVYGHRASRIRQLLRWEEQLKTGQLRTPAPERGVPTKASVVRASRNAVGRWRRTGRLPAWFTQAHLKDLPQGYIDGATRRRIIQALLRRANKDVTNPGPYGLKLGHPPPRPPLDTVDGEYGVRALARALDEVCGMQARCVHEREVVDNPKTVRGIAYCEDCSCRLAPYGRSYAHPLLSPTYMPGPDCDEEPAAEPAAPLGVDIEAAAPTAPPLPVEVETPGDGGHVAALPIERPEPPPRIDDLPLPPRESDPVPENNVPLPEQFPPPPPPRDEKGKPLDETSKTYCRYANIPTHLLNGHDLSDEELVALFKPVFGVVTREQVEVRYRDIPYDGEQRIIVNRNVNEAKLPMRVAEARCTARQRVYPLWLTVSAILVFITCAVTFFVTDSMLTYPCLVTVQGLYYESLPYWPLVTDWLQYNSGPVVYCPQRDVAGLRTLSACVGAFLAVYVIPFLVLRKKDVHFTYSWVPHWVDSVFVDFDRNVNSTTIETTLLAKMRRCAGLPVRDTMHYRLTQGTARVVETLLEGQGFQWGHMGLLGPWP